jgi:predicted amidohydrolase
MKITFFLCSLVAAIAATAPNGVSAQPTVDPGGWRPSAVRQEIAPRTWVDHEHCRSASGSLAISGDTNAAEYGGWEQTVEGIEAGRWYRFTAYYRAAGLEYEPWQVISRLVWERQDGHVAGRPDYPYGVHREGDWTRLALDAQAPPRATHVVLQLYLQNAPRATLWWDDISLKPIPDVGPRKVTVASIKYRPGHTTGSAAASVKAFIAAADKALTGSVDAILFPEGTTVVDTGLTYADVAEPVPGPSTALYGELAKRRHAYVIAGIYEREAQAVYNTAVLIDRDGRFVGKYRKVYIPREEIEGGITPGSDFPVFDTDFGRIGIMICWDSEYPEAARALALNGAEVIFLPTWDSDVTLTQARAIEDHVFLVVSSYGAPTQVLNPNGERLALAPEVGTAAVTTLDLNRRYKDDWLGDMRARMMKDYRGDVEVRRMTYDP